MPRAHAPLVLLPLLWLACSETEVAVRPTATAERTSIERIVVATGTIEPAKEVEIRPRIAGIVERIFVDDGDEIEQGQLLLELEHELLTSRVHEARAAVREAEVAQRFAKLEIDRLHELHSRGAASNRERDQEIARHDGAEARVAAARARLSTLQTQLSYASIRSPLSGRVLDVHTEEGTAVSSVAAVNGGTLLISLAPTDTLFLEGLVDENEVARLTPGQLARIRTEAFGDRVFRGVLREIAPLGERIENVTYFEVEVEIIDPGAELLRPRMSGDAEIVTETVEDALVIPETALLYRGDTIYVETPNGSGPPEQLEIEIGIVDGDQVQAVSGLEPGTRVVLQ